jgi:hypothetical protein
LTSFEALNAFASQLERNITSEKFHTKVVVTPSSVDEKGLIIRVSLLKTFAQREPKDIRASRMLRVRVTVAGTAESHTGLEQAIDAIESLDAYLGQRNLRLETFDGETVKSVLNSRLIQEISQEDGFTDNPATTEVQDVEDNRIVTITIPQE